MNTQDLLNQIQNTKCHLYYESGRLFLISVLKGEVKPAINYPDHIAYKYPASHLYMERVCDELGIRDHIHTDRGIYQTFVSIK